VTPIQLVSGQKLIPVAVPAHEQRPCRPAVISVNRCILALVPLDMADLRGIIYCDSSIRAKSPVTADAFFVFWFTTMLMQIEQKHFLRIL
jgi:hypothetical protein